MKPLRTEIEPGVFTIAGTEHSLRLLLRDRDRAAQEIAEIDRMMLSYRKAYARERGEFVLPSLERLRRELL